MIDDLDNQNHRGAAESRPDARQLGDCTSNGGSRETGRATPVSTSATAETAAKSLDLGRGARTMAFRTKQTNAMS